MSNNKEVGVHISKQDIRLVEGRISQGNLIISRSATIQNAQRFFHGNRLAFMGEMVNTIINTMNVQSFSSKTLHIVYDNGLAVDFFLDEQLAPKKKQSVSDMFGKKKSGAAGKEKQSGVITHKKGWGQYITNEGKGELYTTTTIERDLVDFMVDEFQARGYKVASIEAPETAVMYLRHMAPYSYDSLNKLILYCDDPNRDAAVMYSFCKDKPSGTRPLHLEDFGTESFVEAVFYAVSYEIERTGYVHPQIMLVGQAFANPKEYYAICEKLLDEKYLHCIDLYGIWTDKSGPLDRMRVAVPDFGMHIEMGGQYGLCICELLRAREDKPENLVEGFRPVMLGHSTMKMLASGLSYVALLFLMFQVINTGFGLYENAIAGKEYEKAETTHEVQLTVAERTLQQEKAKIDALSTIDSRYCDIFRFCYAQVSDELNIASVDTKDMIPPQAQSNSAYAPNQQQTDGATGETTEITENAQSTDYEMQTIVIRGYSRTTEGPVKLYNALVGAGLGEVKVVGVEQVPLPTQETLFAFELTVGAN